MIDKELCQRLIDIRGYLKLTQKEFSLKIGVSQGNLADVENFRREPSKKIISNIVSKLDIDGTWFLTGRGEMLQKKCDSSICTNSFGEDPEKAALLKEIDELKKSINEISRNNEKLSKENKDLSAELIGRLKELMSIKDKMIEDGLHGT